MYDSTNYANFKKIFFLYYHLCLQSNDLFSSEVYCKNIKVRRKRYSLVKGPKGHKAGKVILQRSLYKVLVFVHLNAPCVVDNAPIHDITDIITNFTISTPKLYLISGGFLLNSKIF